MYVVADPPAELAEWVECTWELFPGVGAQWRELVPVDLSTDFVISLGSAYGQDGRRIHEHSYLGVRLAPEQFVHGAGNHLLGIRLRPGATFQLFGVGGEALRGTTPIGARPFETLAQMASDLLEDCQNHVAAGGVLARPSVQAQLLNPIYQAISKSRRDSAVRRALRVMYQERCFGVRRLAQRLGTTERTLERRFMRELGVGPKLAARVVRMQGAQREFERGIAGAKTALNWGFTDQAHFCSERRTLLGCASERAEAPPAICRISTRPE